MYFSWMLEMHYSRDTYHTMCMGWSESQLDMIQRNGRPFTAIVYKLYDILNLSIYGAYIQQAAIFYIFTTLSISLLYKIFEKRADKIENKILLFMICVLTIINPCISKLVIFIECGCMLFAVYCQVLASDIQINNKFKMKVEQASILKSVITIALLLIQVCIYQIIPALFVMVCCIYIINDPDENKLDKLKNIACTLSYYGISCVIYLIIFKSTYTGRFDVDEKHSIIQNISYVFQYYLLKIFGVWNLLPYRLEIIQMVLIVVLNAYVYSHNKYKNIFVGLIRAVILVIISIFICYDFIIVSRGYLVPRVEYIFYCTDGLLLLDIILKDKQTNISKNIATILSVIILASNLFLVQDIQVDIFKMNEANIIRANTIIAKIHDYEKETGIKVDSIAAYQDKHSDYLNDIGIKEWQGDMFDMVVQPWQDDLMLNQIAGTDYKPAEKDMSIASYFSQNDWTEPSDELYIFKDNVLHVCAY